jgi:hypothetical protein
MQTPHGLFADIELIERPELRLIDDLLQYWDRKRAGRLGPRRAEIDPAEIKVHLPNIFMVEVVDNGADFRYRLIGTRITEALGRDSTGKKMSELYDDQPQARAQLYAAFRLIVDQQAPVFIRGRVFWLPDAQYRRFTSVVMPLSEDGASVSMTLGEMFIELGGTFS